VEGDTVALDVRREADATGLAEDAPQQPLPILERDAQQGPSVEVEQIEDLVHEPRRRTLARPAGSEPADRLLEQPEIGRAVLFERDDLAVDDRLSSRDPRRRGQETREVGRAVQPPSRVHPDRAVVHDRFDPIAVPLDLEQPVRVVEGGRLGESREHRRDEAG
jgi:hypothetical protein